MAALQSASEFECSVCLELLCEPIQLPCSHVFCRKCLAGVVRENRHCALCRASIPENFNPVVAPLHQHLEQILMRQCTVEYMQRMEDVALEAAHLVRLRIGNEYEFLGFRSRQMHKWTLKVDLEPQPDSCLPRGAMLPDLIKHVRFELLPACTVLSRGLHAFSESGLEQAPRHAEVSDTPFEVTATSPMSCTIPIVVTWQDWVGQPPLRLEHVLDFCRDGGCWDYVVDLHAALAGGASDLNAAPGGDPEDLSQVDTTRTRQLEESVPNSQLEVTAKRESRRKGMFSAGLAEMWRHLPKMQRASQRYRVSPL